MKQFEAGIRGEYLAETYLCRKGMQCIARRFRAADGELDLIMEDGDVLVFVEVKNRPAGKMGDGISAVDGQKRKHLRYAAKCYLAAHPAAAARFDCVEITSSGLRHVSNAF